MGTALQDLCAASGAVGRQLARHPDLASQLQPSRLPSRAELLDEVSTLVTEALDADQPGATIRRSLRRLRYRTFAQLILRDLAGGLDAVEPVTACIAALADALVEGALTFAMRRLGVRHGRPPSWPAGGGFVVLAMGKHGGEELNYCSDIDLIYVVTDHEGRTDGEQPIATKIFADRIGAELGKILMQPTADGFCFRVDLALRPEGNTGPMSASFAAAEQHYLHYGRTWERAAWLKARPCAGDLALGETLLERLSPFRYRRYLDFGTVEDLCAMRDRIAASARLGTLQGDLKRGPGGIRELEFLVQIQQLIYCGRDPELRERSTLPALALLGEKGLLPGVDVAELSRCYRYLRCVEHRLQWPEEEQTQRLPAPEQITAWQALARSMGHPGDDAGVEALRAELQAVRDTVRQAWEHMKAGEQGEQEAPLVDPFATPEERLAALRALGFVQPELAARQILALASAPGKRRMAPGAWRRFERVLPKLIGCIARSADPDEALCRAERFISRVGARGTTYSLLEQNPGVLATLVRLFAESAFLSELLIDRPELLDALVLRGRGGEQPPRDAATLTGLLLADLALRSEEEDRLLALRGFRTVELLRIALADLSGALPGEALPSPWLSELARATVRGAMVSAITAMNARHGVLQDQDDEPVRLGVIGMGSLGSGWMTYGSDLDLVFVYEGRGLRDSSDGPRPIDPATWTARWAQRVITTLSAPTREGRCYEVDMRLRPGGKSGPVVASLASFAAYYAARAEPWEWLALARASVVGGSTEGFFRRIEEQLARSRGGCPVDGPALVAVAGSMRERQRTELSRERSDEIDFKLGPGGLTDIEFALACAQLAVPELRAEPLADPLAALGAIGRLPGSQAADCEALRRSFLAYRRIEAALRLRSGQVAATLVFPSPETRSLARTLGQGDGASLRRAVLAHRRSVVAATERILGSAAAAERT